MKKEYVPDEFIINKDLPGMSLRSLQEHFKLYQGYVKKTNEIQGKLVTADKTEANGIYSFYGELRREETFAVNGMKLHEVYFPGFGGDPSTVSAGSPQASLGQGGKPSGALAEMLARDFGSSAAWQEEMVATGISSRGWAILAFDLKDNRLHVYGSDAQNVGAVWGAIPLIALDVYEHAYFMDHGTNRKAYIEAFFKALDWTYANKLFVEQGLEQKAAQ